MTTGLVVGLVLALLLRPAMRWRSAPLNQWQETLWVCYVGGLLLGGILLSRALTDIPYVGRRISRSPSLFVALWLVPLYILVIRRWIERRRREKRDSDRSP